MFLRAFTIAAKECPRLLILLDPYGLQQRIWIYRWKQSKRSSVIEVEYGYPTSKTVKQLTTY